MLLIENTKLALDSIRNNKLRTYLTLLGIAIGLFSIILVMTAISAIQSSFEDVFSEIGSNNFIIQKYPVIRMGDDWGRYRNRKDISIDEGIRLKEQTTLPQYVGIYLGSSSKVIKYGNEKTNPNVYVTGENLDAVYSNVLEVVDGRMYNKNDIDLSRPVAVLGAAIVEKLFTKQNPIGKTVKIDNDNVEIIGVFKKRGDIMGQSRDNFISIPYTTFRKFYGDRMRSAQLIIGCQSKDLLDKTTDEVIGALRTIRKVHAGEENDFELVTNDQMVQQFNDITKYFKIGAFVIAFIALLASGVGIMNIMLVSVTERTREIGIRKALGAKKIIIRIQFLVEAVILSLVGGAIGIILGVAGGNVVASLLNVPIHIPVDWIIIGISITSLVGIIFGVYPAVKASNLDPIEALRYE
jgi:putative ABC transport system permease protein